MYSQIMLLSKYVPPFIKDFQDNKHISCITACHTINVINSSAIVMLTELIFADSACAITGNSTEINIIAAKTMQIILFIFISTSTPFTVNHGPLQ